MRGFDEAGAGEGQGGRSHVAPLARQCRDMLRPRFARQYWCVPLAVSLQLRLIRRSSDDGEKRTSRPWLSAYMTHLRAIIDKGEIESPSLTSPHLWALHLSADLFTEVHSGHLTSCVECLPSCALLFADVAVCSLVPRLTGPCRTSSS